MSRFVFLVFLALLIAASWFAIRYAKDSYRLLPINQSMNVSSESNFQDWQEYSPSSGNFKVLMPSIPQHVADKSIDQKTKQQKKYDNYIAENKDGTLYMITQITYADPISAKLSAEEILTNVMNDMVASKPENQLKGMQRTEFHKYNALDFSMDNDQFSYEVKAFLVENSLYVLSSIAKKGVDNRKNFDFFVNSFELTTPSK